MRTLSVVAALAAVLGCDESPTSPSDLMGETWRLVSIERTGAASSTAPDAARYTVQFLEGERVAVRADCNTCAGSYVLTGRALSMSALACTRVFCGAASLDGEFTRALGSARSVARAGSRLTIQGNSVALQFRND